MAEFRADCGGTIALAFHSDMLDYLGKIVEVGDGRLK